MISMTHRIATLAAAALMAFAAVTRAGEGELLAVLNSDASLKEKGDACRELAQTGTAAAVPVLARLIDRPDLSHMARYALDANPDPSVNPALRAALGRVKGALRIGVIGSLGVRRDADAVAPLAALLADPDPATARATALSLGSIGTRAAADALVAALEAGGTTHLVERAEGILRCAESALEDGDATRAAALYDRLIALSGAPMPIRVAALRGRILSRGDDRVARLIAAFRGDDWPLAAAAIGVSMDLRKSDVTLALAEEVARSAGDKQHLLIATLGHRGDAAAGPALLAVAGKGDSKMRALAINALTQIGHEPALKLMCDLAVGEDAELAGVTGTCLAGFSGQAADKAILGLLDRAEPKARVIAADLLAQRAPAIAVERLIRAAADKDTTVRVAVLRALRDIAGPDDYKALLSLVLGAQPGSEVQAAEGALAALCARMTLSSVGELSVTRAVYGDLPSGKQADVTKKVSAAVIDGSLSIIAGNSQFGDPAPGKVKNLLVEYAVNGQNGRMQVKEHETLRLSAPPTAPSAVVDGLIASLAGAKPHSKIAVLRVLRSIGGAVAFEAVQAASGDADKDVQGAAKRILCDWPTVEALPILTDWARSSDETAIRLLALRGSMRLIPLTQQPRAGQLAALMALEDLATRPEEKKIMLGVIGQIPYTESLAVAVRHLAEDGLREEAAAAAVAIAEVIAQDAPDPVIAAMKKVERAKVDKQIVRRAKAVLLVTNTEPQESNP